MLGNNLAVDCAECRPYEIRTAAITAAASQRTSQVAPLDVEIVVDHSDGLLLTLCAEASLTAGPVLEPLDGTRDMKDSAAKPR